MVRQGPRPRHIRPAFKAGVTRRSQFSDFLSCDVVVDGGLKDVSALASFVWPSGRQAESDSILEASPQMLKVLADTLSLSTAAALGGTSVGAMPPEVSLACIPFLAPAWRSDSEDAGSESDGLTLRARVLQRGLAGTCITQALVATLQFALNDGISGLIGCCIGTLGMQAASPSGYRFLKHYIVLAFCNGTMQVMVRSELAASHHLFATASAAGLKFANIVSVVSPAMMFLGMVIAWHLHCELRAIAEPSSMRTSPAHGVMENPADGPSGQGADASGPFRAFAGQSHRLPSEAK